MLMHVGMVLLAGQLAHLLLRFRRVPPAGPWHPLAALGILMLASGQVALVLHWEPIYLHFTPWMWTGFIFLADAGNYRLSGNSLILTRRPAFWVLLPISILFWVLFEIYNLRLVNWIYVGLPENLVHRYLAYGWAFATILPAIFEAAELYYNVFFTTPQFGKPWPISQGLLRASMLTGLIFLVAPPLFDPTIAQYLFGFVWMGVIFALDPWNYRWGRRSLFGDLERGCRQRIAALWWGGVLCGFLWEFWNYWALAKWIYIFPILQDWKIFEMPILGFVGFPFFALECFVFCEWVMGQRLRGFARLED